MDIAARHQLSQEDVLRGESTDALRNVVHELACAAVLHLNTARAQSAQVPVSARRVLLPAVPCADYLQRLQAHDFDLFNTALQARNGFLPFAILKHRFLNTF